MNAENIIREMRQRLLGCRGRYREVAARSGLSISWISQFSRGVKDDPKLRTAEALIRALDEMAA
jgi:transcriptional regulator with XRE-family HTH domain